MSTRRGRGGAVCWRARAPRPRQGLCLALFVALAGCGSSTPPPATAPPPAATPPASPSATPAEPATSQTVARPGRTPGTSPDSAGYPPAWRPPESGPDREAKRVLDTLPEPATVALPRDLPRRPPATSLGAVPGECHTVQLLVLSDAPAATRAAREAESRLGVPARAVASGSGHRVWVGSCLAREAAEALRERARAAGYPDAFVTSESKTP